MPSPPDGIDIISPPIVFDWQLIDGVPGYQFKIVKRNEPTNSSLREKIYRVGPDIGHVEINYQEDTSGFFRDASGKLTGGTQGYEWYVRFCTGDDINLCGDNYASDWTPVRTFTLEQNLVKDSMSVYTDSRDPSLRRKGGAGAIYTTVAQGWGVDIFMGAVFTGVLSFNPYASMYDSGDWTGITQVGQKLKIELSIPDVTYEGRDRFVRRPPPPPPPPATWGARGGSHDEPVIWWVKDANKIRTDMADFPSEYLYEQIANMGSLGTYKPKMGLAVTDPRQTTSTVEVEIFDKLKCDIDPETNFLICPPAAKSTNLVLAGEKDGKWVLQANGPTTALIQVKIAGVISTQVLVSDINPNQAWYQGGTWTSELKSFDIVVQDRSIESEAGTDKKTSSNIPITIGPGTVLGMDKFLPETNPGEPIKEMVPNPGFNPALPPDPITNPPTIIVPLATEKREHYAPEIVWKCEDENGNDVTDSVLDDPKKANPIFKKEVEKDEDYKCTFIINLHKITEIFQTEKWNPATGKVEPAVPPIPLGAPTDEIIMTVSDWMMVTVTYKAPNQKPTLDEAKTTPGDLCQALNYILSWNYSDPDQNPIWGYEITINGTAKPVELSDNTYSEEETISYAFSTAEYGTEFTWSVKVWDKIEDENGNWIKGEESEAISGPEFTTPDAFEKATPALNISKDLKGKTIPGAEPPNPTTYPPRTFEFTDGGSTGYGDNANFTLEFGDGETYPFTINTADTDDTNNSWPSIIHTYKDSKKLHIVKLIIDPQGDSSSCTFFVEKTLRESVPTYSEPEGIEY